MVGGQWPLQLVEYTPTDRFEIGPERVRISTFRNTLKVGDTLSLQITQDGTPNTYILTPPNPPGGPRPPAQPPARH